jgi:hypothetical protein
MATPYESCYEVFLRHIKDESFLYPLDDEFDVDFENRITGSLLELFKSAVVHFFSASTSLKRDDTTQMFVNNLREVEIEIIGLYMIREYYRGQLNFFASLKDSFSDKDFKSHDKGNQMNQYRQMLKEIEDEISILIINNSQSDNDGKYVDWLNS